MIPGVRINACFSGRVQGVGFRFKTRQIATGYEVTGFVRNLPDGRVEMTAEGEASETTAFLADLKDTMAVFIQQTESSESPATGEFRGFEIRM